MGDYINRQDAVDALCKGCGSSYCGISCEEYIAIKNLPSVDPERLRGKWIEYIPEHGKCPFCGNQVDLLNGKANNFCSECGADMRG